MSRSTVVTVTIAASVATQRSNNDVVPSGWAAYAQSGSRCALLATGADPYGGTPARMYLTALVAAMNELKWACDVTVVCNDVNIVRGVNVHLDKFRERKFREKQRNKDLWVLVVETELRFGHNLVAAYAPSRDDPVLIRCQNRARSARAALDPRTTSGLGARYLGAERRRIYEARGKRLER